MSDTEEIATERTIAIVNARVWTGDDRRPWADAVLVRGARIVGIGSSAEIRKRAGTSAVIVDARSMMVVPGASAGRIATGFPANLIVVERAVDGVPAAPRDDEIVLALEEGAVVVDRDGMVS